MNTLLDTSDDGADFEPTVGFVGRSRVPKIGRPEVEDHQDHRVVAGQTKPRTSGQMSPDF